MALKDMLMILVALALPIWLLVEQVIWWASSKERQGELDGAGLPVAPTRREKARTPRGPMLRPLPRNAA